MGKALEVITGFAIAPGATLTNLTMAAGNSLTVRATNPDAKCYILEMWAHNQAAGIFRVRSPKMHDFVQGIRKRSTTVERFPLLGTGQPQIVFPQDILTAELSGSAVGGQIETGCLLMYYDNIQGIDAHMIAVDELHRRARNHLPVEVTNAVGAGGGYSGEVAINSSFDLMKANTDYACIGAMVDTASAVVGIRGVDSGNLRCGVPGLTTLRHTGARWFLELAERFGLPLIPVFNSANKGAILCDAAQNQAAASINTTWNLVELGPAGA